MKGMNSFKGVMITLLLMISIASYAQPRPGKTPRERAENQTHWMDKNLGLSREQSKKVYDIVLYYAKEADKTARNMPPGREKGMEKQGIRIDREKELKQVLSADQYDRYMAHMQEMKERRKAMKNERRGNGY